MVTLVGIVSFFVLLLMSVCGDCWVIVVATARGDGTGKVKLKAVKITVIPFTYLV